MSDWIEGVLPEFAELQSGCTVSTAQFGKGVKYITVQQLYHGNVIDVTKAPRADLSIIDIERYQLVEGDILLGKSSVKLDGIGYPAWFEDVGETVAYSNFTVRLRSKGILDQKFFFYWLKGEESRRWIISQAQHSALTNINQGILNRFPIKYPRLMAEQQKIARILQTIDQAIEKTEVRSEKYQQIKAGLMHDLFTRGIGVDGKLRPPREQAPELYQQTPIGWIPKEWRHELLEKMLAPVANNLRSGPFGSAMLKSELVEDGVPFLGIDNIHVERFDGTFRRFVSEKKYRELLKYAVRPKDVVITIMGTVGRSAVIPSYVERALSSKHLWTMSLNEEVVIPELVCWQLNYAPWAKSWFGRETQGGIMDAIQSKTLRTLRLPLPPLGEQKDMFARYLTVSGKIAAGKEELEKLRKEKAGLMHDLLTGNVRVKLNEPSPEMAGG